MVFYSNNLKNKHAHKATRDDDGDSSDNSEPSKPETWEGITILGVTKRHLSLTRRDQNMNIIKCFREMFLTQVDDFEWVANLNGVIADAGGIVRDLEPEAVAGWYQWLDIRCFNKLG